VTGESAYVAPSQAREEGSIIMKAVRLLLVFLIVALVGGCSLSGRVYLAFFWDDADLPISSFACTAPNVPTGFASIVKGKYYETVPGVYKLDYTYTAGPNPVTFSLETQPALLGQEHAYYQARLTKATAPTIGLYP
jgi:hypothetical protein